MRDQDKRRMLRTERASDEGDVERAARQVRSQLEQRGVRVHDEDDPEGEAVMLEAVEAFEAAVRRCGGDSYTNSLQSSRPDRQDFVLPPRGDDERADTYARRVRAAATALVPPSADGPGHDTTV